MKQRVHQTVSSSCLWEAHNHESKPPRSTHHYMLVVFKATLNMEVLFNYHD